MSRQSRLCIRSGLTTSDKGSTMYYAEIIEIGNGQWALNLNTLNHSEVYHNIFESFSAAHSKIDEIKSAVKYINVVMVN
jgi:hypothetical protein